MPLRIAVADDEPSVLGVVAAWLRKLGHLPVRVGGGEELLRLCIVEPPDLAICDVDMPGVCGFKAAEAIRTLTPVPVILMSGRWDEDRQTLATGLGVAFMAKPINPLDLVRAIEDATRPRDGVPPAVL